MGLILAQLTHASEVYSKWCYINWIIIIICCNNLHPETILASQITQRLFLHPRSQILKADFVGGVNAAVTSLPFWTKA